MNLEVQMQVCVFSFFFGMWLSLEFNFLYCFIKKINRFLKFFIQLLLILLNVTLYFIILYYINNGIISIYILFMLINGFLFANIKTKKIRKY